MNQITNIQAALPNAEPVVKMAVGRRGFLSAGAAFGGGLLLNLSLTRNANAVAVATSTVNVFVVIGADNSIKIIAPGGEMGQGINSGLAQVLAEELPLNWSALSTVPAPFGAQYGRGATHSQVTGGSFNMRGWFQLMLQAGATAREMLLAAARAGYPSAPTPLKAVAGRAFWSPPTVSSQPPPQPRRCLPPRRSCRALPPTR
jgi:isoquinoline 1-oxidoreductase subunit beta